MENEKLIAYIENSFLKELLKDDGITDISFNGQHIFYLHNELGRRKSDILINQSEAKDFVRQIANLTEKQFSYQVPELDVSIGKYRINAIHQSIGRVGNSPSITFSIRVASATPRISDDSGFLTPELVCLFEALLKSHQSIVIGGLTGTGKTEFQKYLIRKLPYNERVIVIDNVLELDQTRFDNEFDINSWQFDDKNAYSSIQSLVRNALRSNPDWLIVAESRGGEMIEVLNSAMTGHPIITTIHSMDVLSMPNRITRMAMMGDKKSDYQDIQNDVNYHFKYYVFLERFIDDSGKVFRYIKNVLEISNNGDTNIIYSLEDGRHHYGKIKDMSQFRKDTSDLFKKVFLGEKN